MRHLYSSFMSTQFSIVPAGGGGERERERESDYKK